MKKLKKIIYVLIYIIGVSLAIGSILSLFRNSEIRYFKMLDFPRIQMFIASFLGVVILIFLVKRLKWQDYILGSALIVGLIINGSFLFNYTPLVPVEVPFAATNQTSENTTTFSLLLANVKMKNRNAEKLIHVIENKKPDLILAMEVNKWWDNKLKFLEKDYPYSQHTINEVAYGMVLFSKFPLEKIDIDYLNNKKVPSFESTIALTEDKDISFHCIHPVPPTLFKKYPDNSGQDEVAMKKLGNEIIDRKYPSLVAGDLNDVVWSYVDNLTGTKNILNDVRVGRGFYNSYNAKSWFMRWPLDHVFVTEEFKLKKLERMPKIGSDHFPIYVELVL